MAIQFLKHETKDRFIKRVDAIQEDTPQQWGKMDAIHMFAHILYSVRASLEEVQQEYSGNLFLKYVMRYVAFHTPLPWPKGLQTAPGYVREPEGDFNTVKADLKAAMERFVQASHDTPERRTLHPVFGSQPLSYWPRLHGQHMDHHLRQFGV